MTNRGSTMVFLGMSNVIKVHQTVTGTHTPEDIPPPHQKKSIVKANV